ncbi:MAG: hypothetical protein J7K33_06970 [Candidatus Marinimicrobia bacterium]|nr:hypothetical protein [Candidatus Neomarinimicrobiota bacterium]
MKEEEKQAAKVETPPQLEPSQEELVKPPQEPWYSKCPICTQSALQGTSAKKLFGLKQVTVFQCPNCSSRFEESKDMVTLLQLSSLHSSLEARFGKKCCLRPDEWHRIAYGGLSDAELEKCRAERAELQRKVDLEYIQKKISCGDMPLVYAESPIMLKKGEKLIVNLPNIELNEERSVKIKGGYTGVSFRVIKGVYLRTGRFGGGTERRLVTLDVGNLVITNQRFVFSGPKRSINVKLDRIIGIDAYADGFVLNRSNKQKAEVFVGLDKITANVQIDNRSYQMPLSGETIKSIIEYQFQQM